MKKCDCGFCSRENKAALRSCIRDDEDAETGLIQLTSGRLKSLSAWMNCVSSPAEPEKSTSIQTKVSVICNQNLCSDDSHFIGSD